MAFAVLDDVSAKEVQAHWPGLISRFRHAFFQGGRRIEATAEARWNFLSKGFSALYPIMLQGVWDQIPSGLSDDLKTRVHDPFGSVQPGSPFEEWIAPLGSKEVSRDQLLGTIGGGNHFVELQEVAAVHDGGAAWSWGVEMARSESWCTQDR